MNPQRMSFEPRLLALALLVLPLAIIAAITAHLWQARSVYHAQLATVRSQTRAYEQLLSEAPQRQRVASRIVRDLTQGGFILPAANAGTAGKTIEARLQELLRQVGVSGARIDTEFRQQQAIEFVIARVTVECPIAELSRALYAMQKQRPRLFVEQLRIDDVLGGRIMSGPHILQVSMSVVGVVRAP